MDIEIEELDYRGHSCSASSSSTSTNSSTSSGGHRRAMSAIAPTGCNSCTVYLSFTCNETVSQNYVELCSNVFYRAMSPDSDLCRAIHTIAGWNPMVPQQSSGLPPRMLAAIVCPIAGIALLVLLYVIYQWRTHNCDLKK
jgi:hypothetical protein